MSLSEDVKQCMSFDKFTFEEAKRLLGSRLVLTAEEFYALSEKYRSLAFTVSGYTAAEVLNQFHKELVGAIEEGSTAKSFQKSMNGFLERAGLEGLSSYQAYTIFRTNLQTAFQAGHYRAMTDPQVLRLRPYWQYDAVNDKKTRPEHLAMDGRVFPADSPVWDTWYPPNGYRCRCGVNSLSKRQVEEQGLTVETEPPKAVELPGGRVVTPAPDKAFGVNPAKETFQPDMEGYPESIKKAFERQQKKGPEPAGENARK